MSGMNRLKDHREATLWQIGPSTHPICSIFIGTWLKTIFVKQFIWNFEQLGMRSIIFRQLNDVFWIEFSSSVSLVQVKVHQSFNHAYRKFQKLSLRRLHHWSKLLGISGQNDLSVFTAQEFCPWNQNVRLTRLASFIHKEVSGFL